jgi:hypothetical protein
LSGVTPVTRFRLSAQQSHDEHFQRILDPADRPDKLTTVASPPRNPIQAA